MNTLINIAKPTLVIITAAWNWKLLNFKNILYCREYAAAPIIVKKILIDVVLIFIIISLKCIWVCMIVFHSSMSIFNSSVFLLVFNLLAPLLLWKLGLLYFLFKILKSRGAVSDAGTSRPIKERKKKTDYLPCREAGKNKSKCSWLRHTQTII